MPDEVQGIDPMGPAESFNLILPDPHPRSETVNQDDRLPLSFYGIKDGASIDHHGQRRKRGIPVNSVGPNEKKTGLPSKGPPEERKDPP
jgi:hypothetical protein